LFSLLQRGDLTLSGTEQLESFERRAHVCFMCGVRRRYLFLLLLACRTQSDQVLCALELLVLGVQLRQKSEILRFCFREFAAEDDC
jgi:hypothetical protein